MIKFPEQVLPSVLGEKVFQWNPKHVNKATAFFVFPAANTPVCQATLQLVSERIKEFEDAGVTPIGICTDNTPSIKAWVLAEKIDCLVLSDFANRQTVNNLTNVRPDGTALRGMVLFDKNRQLVFMMAGEKTCTATEQVNKALEYAKHAV